MIEAVAANVAGRGSGVKLSRTERFVCGDFASNDALQPMDAG
jgi:hypothetical protein